MKKSIVSSLILTAIMASTTAFAATDWTSHLEGMKDTCNDADIHKLIQAKILPKALQSSVSKKQGKIIDGNGKITLTLKNATAFGEPLSKIEIDSDWGGEASSTTLHFANNNFMNLLPQFYVNDGLTATPVGTQQLWLTYALYNTKDSEDIYEFYESQDMDTDDMYEEREKALNSIKPAVQKRFDVDLKIFDHYKSLSDIEKMRFVQNFDKRVGQGMGYDLESYNIPQTYLDFRGRATGAIIIEAWNQNSAISPELIGYQVSETGFNIKPYINGGTNTTLKFDKKTKTITCDSVMSWGD